MSGEATPRWALPLLHSGQAMKELFHNEALTIVDMLVGGRVESADVAAPPPSPEMGQCWIVGSAATGAWEGRDGQLAGWSAGGWRFVAPRGGLRVFVADRDHAMQHDGSAWRDDPIRSDGLFIADAKVVGDQLSAISDPVGGSSADAEARAAISAILSALRTHGLIAS